MTLGALCVALAVAAERAAARSVATTKVEIEDLAPAEGPRLAPVVAEVFCPYVQSQCAGVYTTMATLARRHPKRLRVVYRQFPLNHSQDSLLLAEIALEAAAQGKSAAFQKAMFAARPNERRELVKLARAAGLDASALDAALADHRHRAQIGRDEIAADRLGVTMSPAVVWNGKTATGATSLDASEQRYDEAFARAQQLLDEGVSSKKLYGRLLADAARQRAAEARATRTPATSHKPGADTPTATPVDLDAARVSVPTAGAPVRGAVSPTVTVVVFADFQCPHCRHLMQTLAAVLAAYPDDVQLVFKHAPVDTHRDAALAARAAACAQRQERFWEYATIEFVNPARLSKTDLTRYAKDGRLDVKQFSADLDSGRCDARVEGDVADARALGIYGTTPVVFVNGLQLVGDRPFSDFRLIIDEETRPGLLEQATAD